MANQPTESEKRFDTYLAVHGYLGEADIDWRSRLGVDTLKNPDRLVTRAAEELAICEVKEWRSSPLDRIPAGQKSATFSSEQVFGTAADAVQTAAREQLRPFRDVGLPLVVVLANPHHRFVPLAPRDMTMSLFGTSDVIQLPASGPPVARRISKGVGALVALDGRGEVFNPHPYLSAVVVVHARERARDFIDEEVERRRRPEPLSGAEREEHATELLTALNANDREGRTPTGEYEWVEVFDLSGLGAAFSGTPLPENIFDGELDRWYVVDGGNGFVESETNTRGAGGPR